MIWLLTPLALAGLPAPVDLDGDGTAETFRVDDYTIHVGQGKVECDGESCELEVHDIVGSDRKKEVAICALGPRDDRSCVLHRYAGGALHPIPWPKGGYAPQVRTSGNGLVLAVDGYRHRLVERIEKYRYADGALTRVPQPIYSAQPPKPLPVDETFPLRYGPGDERVVANARPKSEILILGEHGEREGWLLVRLSSGITGWVQTETLERASIQYMQIMGAG